MIHRLAAALALCLAPLSSTFASTSSSQRFQISASAVGDAGVTKRSLSFAAVGSAGQAGASSGASTSFAVKAGLMPIYFQPGAILDLVAFSCTPGEVILTWTAPGNDGYAAGTRAKSYRLRVSTDPALAPALSEAAFAAASTVAAAPLPALRGASESVTLTGLPSGVTHYFAIAAVEADGSRGPLSTGSTGYASVTGPPPPSFAAVTGFKRSLLSWAVPASPAAACSAAAYRIYRSTDPAGTFAAVAQTSATAHTDLAVAAGTTYFYRIAALNPASAEISATAQKPVWVRTAPPLPTPGFEVMVGASSDTLRWDTPLAYEFGQPFADPSALTADELTGFEIWRSTSIAGPWTMMTAVSSGTTGWADTVPLSRAFYRLVAANITERSEISLVREAGGTQNFSLAPDGKSVLVLPPEAADALSAGTGYVLKASSGVASQPTDGSQVFASAAWEVYTADGRATQFRFPSPITVRVAYEVQGGALVPAGGALAAAVAAAPAAVAPEQASLYWHNGAKWVQIFGRQDAASGELVAQTEYGGSFQIRGTARTSDFSFDSSGVSNRYLTPNADHRNDNVVFTFNNPRDSQITGRIFDVQGGLVTTLGRKTQFTMEWDGTANGRPVPGGVYLYQLEGDGRKFTGTVVVVK